MLRNAWQEQLRRGSLEFAILLAVSAGPRYGLAIIEHLEALTDLVVTEGTIYPLLGRLTRDGLLASWWVDNEAPHARKYYRVTALGSRRLAEMKDEWATFTAKISRLILAAEGAAHDPR
jgi:PadR family transcriptional regulator PadR